MATKKKKDPVEPEAPPVQTLETIPGSMFDANVVRASAKRQLQEMEDRHNFNRRFHFLRAVANWLRNLRGPVPQPPLMVHYLWVETESDNDPRVVEGPEFVAEPYVPPVDAPFAAGIVAFGYPIDDGTGSYYVGPTNTVRPGTHAFKDDNEYVFVLLRSIGGLKVKMWIPVGA